MHRHTGDLTGGVQTGNHGRVVGEHLTLDVRRDAAHRVVRGGLDRDRVRVRLDTEVGPGELGDVGQLGVQLLRREVGQVQVDVVALGTAAAALADLRVDGARDDVTGGEVLHDRRVLLHEALAVLVAQDAALTAGALRQQDAHAPDAGRVELEELHVLQRQTPAVDGGLAVTGEGVRVRRHLEELAAAAGGVDHGLRLEDVDLTGGQLVRHHAGRLPDAVDLGDQLVQDVELVEELHALLDAVLVQRLEDHVAGAVRGVAGPADRGLAVVTAVTAEAALVDGAVRGAVERQAHLLQVEDRVDGLLRQDLRGVLVDQVVTALDRVEGVPLPVVLLHVGQRRGHAALRGARVGAGGVELGQHGGAAALRRLDRGAHAGAARADDDCVVLVDLHQVFLSPVPSGCSGRR
ncbi:hypothetical protein BN159_3546 [Streptomyces davaonensis JCM 4913]|uniref:Uncharacterized protein n=1 Tax=Streptomyces davaonensis (strain DSM 101723 / JCM 4913 / KCC S-0913 / 768) TaxID=1214101 RepID=K4R4D4_STRDJ|nr:hypothetical protein BN159_3546 [Streptomyces davaonensis JCM 4913]